ncbi:MAG TPA: hypothetical protein VFH56_12960 [Acidimicrobiales bacterium]|nr:hypothetical protein [Acidimicrobiales bacterium]
MIKATAAGFATALVAAAVVIPPASAGTTGAVPFSQAHFSGYATGTELHLGTQVLDSLSTLVGTNLSQATGLELKGLDQGFSSASTNSAGLTSNLTSELSQLIQPAQAAGIKAFNEGQGLNLSLGGATGQQLSSLANTILAKAQTSIPGPAVSLAPPNLPLVQDVSNLSLDPIVNAQNLLGEAQANFPTAACPSSNISDGLGNLTSANILTGLPALTTSGVNSAPLISTVGNGTSAAQSQSTTGLVSNGDGTYGIQTVASDIIAPITLNLLGLATVQIAVQSAGGVDHPVTLTSRTTGEGTGASVVPSTDDILTVVMSVAGGNPVTLANVPLSSLVGTNGMDIPLTINGLTQLLSTISVPSVLISTLQNVVTQLGQVANNSTVTDLVNTINNTVIPALQQVATPVTSVVSTITSQPTVAQLLKLLNGVLSLDLGSIHVGMKPHAIGNPGQPPTAVGGTQAAGAMDLLNVNLGLNSGTLSLGNLNAAGQLVPNIIPAGTLQGITSAITIPVQTINLVSSPLPLADFTAGHLETQAIQQQPISCSNPQVLTKSQPQPQKALPFTGGPGGLWQPVVGIGALGVGGFSLALVRRLRKRSAV